MNSNHRNVETSKRQNDARERSASGLHDSTFGRFDVSASPDFTRRVMGRLGYMRVSQANARRERVRQWTRRAGLVLTVAVCIGVANRMYESSDQVRRPQSLTIPAAVGNDMRQQQHRIENVIRSIRSVVPAQPRVIPIRAPHREEPDPPQIEGDFDQPKTSPFRWV